MKNYSCDGRRIGLGHVSKSKLWDSDILHEIQMTLILLATHLPQFQWWLLECINVSNSTLAEVHWDPLYLWKPSRGHLGLSGKWKTLFLFFSWGPAHQSEACQIPTFLGWKEARVHHSFSHTLHHPARVRSKSHCSLKMKRKYFLPLIPHVI